MLASGILAPVARLALALAAFTPVAVDAHLAELDAVLKPMQEIPQPDAPTTATGTAQFVLGEDGIIQAEVVHQGLAGPPTMAHIHRGAPGANGPVVVDFTPRLAGPFTILGPGIRSLTPEERVTLFGGGMYFDIHTARNPDGEIFGQLRLKPGVCSCDDATSPRDFKRCVRTELRSVARQERREPSTKALRRLVAKSACGRQTAPKKGVACCLPFNPAQNIVTDRLCAAVKQSRCAKIGGTSLGAGIPCSPNPCHLGSASGASLALDAD